MTSTRPMMDSVQVQPLAAGMPMVLRPSWSPTMMAETSHWNGNSSAATDVHPIPPSVWPGDSARPGLRVTSTRPAGGDLLRCVFKLYLPLGMLAAGVQPPAGSPPGQVVGRRQPADGLGFGFGLGSGRV